ncbi:MAG: MarR family winged helix-turn-helix transcriptional regulator [Solirubrobacteraceae bacterium]|nr:MarR family winged helix-turn-helix transcriptional regulator [Patulibacter sp.]
MGASSRDLSAPPTGDRHQPLATLGQQLHRAEQALVARKAEMLRPFDLTVPQYGALALLVGDATKSVSRMGREALVTSQTMTGIVGNLEAKGLVERRASPDHARVHLVSLTADGLDVALRAGERMAAVERDVLAALPPTDAELLAALLVRVADAAPDAGA